MRVSSSFPNSQGAVAEGWRRRTQQ